LQASVSSGSLERLTSTSVSCRCAVRMDCRGLSTDYVDNVTQLRSLRPRPLYHTARALYRNPTSSCHTVLTVADTLNNHNTTITDKAVMDRRLRPLCCHLWTYFKNTSFSCCYICMDRHYVQTWCHRYSTRPLQSSRPWLQVVPNIRCLQRVFVHAVYIEAQGCVSASAWRRHRAASAYVQTWRHS